MAVCIFPYAKRAGIRDARDPNMGAVNEQNRARNVAQRPKSYCEIEHCARAGVMPEAKGQIVVTAGLGPGERALKVIPRLAILTANQQVTPTRRCANAGLGIGSRLDVAEEGRSVRPHRWQLAPHVADGIQTVVDSTPASGVTDTVVGIIDLSKEPAHIEGRLLRLR